MSQVRELTISLGPLSGGIAFFPYQLALGISLRYWPCIFAPAFRIYLGPFKLWGYISFGREADRGS